MKDILHPQLVGVSNNEFTSIIIGAPLFASHTETVPISLEIGRMLGSIIREWFSWTEVARSQSD